MGEIPAGWRKDVSIKNLYPFPFAPSPRLQGKPSGKKDKSSSKKKENRGRDDDEHVPIPGSYDRVASRILPRLDEDEEDADYE